VKQAPDKKKYRKAHLNIKGTVSRDFLLLIFFHESVSPKPMILPLGPFRIGDIRSSRLPPVSLTPVANGKNLQSEKFL
jgi:hypothetical protein